MKSLIVAATYTEIAPFMEHFNIIESEFSQKKSFDVLITGVGMTATAFSLGKFLHNNYKSVINVGIAGSFNKELPIGTIVNIIQDTFSELGAESGDSFVSIDELGFGRASYHGEKIDGIDQVSGITVNTVNGNSVSINQVIKRLNPETESMEGAAVFYCASKYNIPAIQIRCISNYVEPRNKENWNISLAINNLNNWLIKHIEQ